MKRIAILSASIMLLLVGCKGKMITQPADDSVTKGTVSESVPETEDTTQELSIEDYLTL